MNIRFNTILVPVDFTVNTEVAIKKALSLCEGSGAAIHLLHVSRVFSGSIFSPYQYYARCMPGNRELMTGQIDEKFAALKTFSAGINKDITVFAWTSMGHSVEKTIIEKAQRLRVDLIVIGKNSHHSRLPFLNTVVPARIARRAGIAVLTVKPGALNNQIKTIVVTVDNQFPGTKLAIIDALKRKFRVHVRLVAFLGVQDNSAFLPHSLLSAYRYLKSNPVNLVSYDVLQTDNKPKAILNYCKKVNADVLIVNPESETRTGWMNRHISDMLPVDSKTQVLSVQPA